MRKPVLDHGNVLPVHRVVTGYGSQRRRVPGDRYTGVTTWRRRDGSVVGRIGHTAEIHSESTGTLMLDYTLNGQPVRQVFQIIGRPCRFGGVRWLALCPQTGRPVAKLYGCCGTFQPRHLLNASYSSQDRVPPTEKLQDREQAILRRLGADGRSYGDPPKPKWMRWPTYSRLALELRSIRYSYGEALALEFRRKIGVAPEDTEDADLVVGRINDLAGWWVDE